MPPLKALSHRKWSVRRWVGFYAYKLIKQILKYKPDSLGIQEGDYGWMNEHDGLPALLEGYSYVGVGRDDGKTLGEYAAIFYLKEKYDIIDSGTFWISETPDTPSMGWDAVANRICTWAILKNKENGEVYTHFNTHLDHVGKQARTEGVKLLIDKISKCQTPFVLTGDFNFMKDSKDYKTIIESDLLLDSKLVAEDTMSHGTINWFLPFNFKYLKPIDFCFVSKDHIKVYKYRVDNSYWADGHPVSDHYPIIVDFELIK
ncbi:endonuclease/exonuclease/phosphatase family protein [Paramaledivibacter caminithermalis]|jgi:endonuclease/exonuclease/phosphatase family metal-dependent hydrolase|uniref:Metal-dependent hydrolase, endonuclease/exonuclease/phosphatase family n=1 Tax=Paramaledivibacter caminithermalis (strain DSM 15212 / CIP 107654 / DViRD3) TaxID=1121301 RepID=A0A1M6T8U4_PARC5|nr:endonuclease/exonuclease/phosphatase family protein [Paramaledivibacter caminithermalis]SHK53421.1 Metal-dependent hydrolase, endonuclease/exonuclease/phosphatase family [Paramaledivibacter caminithermalis DSM 15212]